MHHYIKDGKPFESETPLYYFAWVYGHGHVTFGMHGSEVEYQAKVEQNKRAGGIWAEMRLVEKTPIQEFPPETS